MPNECESSENQMKDSFGMIWSGESGKQVSNTWVTCPSDGDNPPKGGLIPDGEVLTQVSSSKGSGAEGWARGRLASW